MKVTCYACHSSRRSPLQKALEYLIWSGVLHRNQGQSHEATIHDHPLKKTLQEQKPVSVSLAAWAI
jgi:hypothetical protein